MRRAGFFVAAAIAFAAPLRSQQPAAPQPAAPVASVNDSALEARTTELARELRCPVCQGLSIQESPSELSQQMRAVVKDQLAQGKTDAEVRAYFVSKYGEWILLAPKPTGFNWFVYLAPWIVLAAGAVWITARVRRWTNPAPDPATAPAAPGDAPPPAQD